MKKIFVAACLAVLPVWSAVFAQSLDDKISAAVQGLEQSRRLEVAVRPPVIQGTNTVTALSDYLQGEIRHYAVNSPAFTVVERAGDAAGGAIEGWYLDTGTSVRVMCGLCWPGIRLPKGPRNSSIYPSMS
jgi:hypothetical protein